MTQQLQSGITHLKEATKIRQRISAIYRRYRSLSKVVQNLSKGKIKHFDVKRAVDAVHYFGGGWPHPKSKGRMEAMLDSFAGMYKVLHATGRGDMVKDYLRKKGITVNLTKVGQLRDLNIDADQMEYISKKYGLPKATTLFELMNKVINECDHMQGKICGLADIVRDDLKPKIEEELDVDSPEYKRLMDVMKLKMGTERAEARINPKVKKVHSSFSNYHFASEAVKKVPRIKEKR